MEKFNVYTFNLSADKYYFICKNALKDEYLHKYDLDDLRKVTKYLEQEYPSQKYYEYDFNLGPGTVLDSDYNIIYTPATNYITNIKEEGYVKCFAIDGTHINIYSIGDRRLIGTKNSWDVTNLKDIFNETYSALLQETLDVLNIQELPQGTYLFCNPKVHLLNNDYKIYQFTLDNPTVPGCSKLPSVDDAAWSDHTATVEWLLFYPELNVYVEDISKYLKGVNNLLYLHRNRFHSDDSRLALLFCICNLLCFGGKYKRYLSKNKCLNNIAFTCYKYLQSLKKELKQNKSDMFYGIIVPKRFNTKNSFKPTYKNFWFNVLANAIKTKDILFSEFGVTDKKANA